MIGLVVLLVVLFGSLAAYSKSTDDFVGALGEMWPFLLAIAVCCLIAAGVAR